MEHPLNRLSRIAQKRFEINKASRHTPGIAFRLHQMDQSTCPGLLQFWREQPQTGLTGVSEIVLADRGITSENVSYDVNLASDMLRRAMHQP